MKGSASLYICTTVWAQQQAAAL